MAFVDPRHRVAAKVSERFEYCRPPTLGAALDVLAAASSTRPVYPLAGGTAISILARQGLLEPGLLVDLSDIAPLRGVASTHDGAVRIGALTTLREVETHPLVLDRCEELSVALGRVASVRIRNQATLGGNLVHADPAQDPPPVLLALDALVEVASARSQRTIPVEEFLRGPFETALTQDEIVTAIVIPPLPLGAAVRYAKYVPRSADDYATVSVAVRLDREPDGRIAGARIVVGAAGPMPTRITAAEAELVGRKVSEVDLGIIAERVKAAVEPVDDLRGSAAYKRAMAGLWTRRTIEALVRHGPEVDARAS